jgi:hypothetical protein
LRGICVIAAATNRCGKIACSPRYGGTEGPLRDAGEKAHQQSPSSVRIESNTRLKITNAADYSPAPEQQTHYCYKSDNEENPNTGVQPVLFENRKVIESEDNAPQQEREPCSNDRADSQEETISEIM